MIYNIDDTFPSRKYKNKTIREVLKIDSGYIKDYLLRNKDFILSAECLLEAQKITKGNIDKAWVKPEKAESIFDYFKPYRLPYDYDFNDKKIIETNNFKLKEHIKDENSK